MIGTILYQTVANKHKNNIENMAPFKCTRADAWLGDGYYFWDTFIELAHQWGVCALKNNYIICKTHTKCHAEEILDLVGNTTQIKDLRDITLQLEKTYNKRLTVPFVMHYLRERLAFPYKAIRIQSHNNFSQLTTQYKRVFIDGRRECFLMCPSIQYCVIDRTILELPVKVVYCSSEEYNMECL